MFLKSFFGFLFAVPIYDFDVELFDSGCEDNIIEKYSVPVLSSRRFSARIAWKGQR